jgi:hypothetical protein
MTAIKSLFYLKVDNAGRFKLNDTNGINMH